MSEMECGCTSDSCITGWGTVDWVHTWWRKAKSKRECCECERIIPAGEVYEYVMASWEEERYHTITCRQCVTMWHEYNCNCRVYGGGVLRGHIWKCLGVDIVTGMTKDVQGSI